MNKGDRISESESLLRRVFRKDKRYINPKNGRPTSRAFAPRPKDQGKLSVDIERLTTLKKAISDAQRFYLFGLKAKAAFDLGLNCIYDPTTLQEDGFDNPAHALIIDFEEDDESKPGILARQAYPIAFSEDD